MGRRRNRRRGYREAKPDVIFAIYETIDKQTYERLSQIAPTVIQSADYPDEETPWDVQLLTTGKALGKEAEAKELVGKVQGRIDEAPRPTPSSTARHSSSTSARKRAGTTCCRRTTRAVRCSPHSASPPRTSTATSARRS